MLPIQKDIAEYLKTRCYGKNKTIKHRKLTRLFEVHEAEMRALVSDLITDTEMPIATISGSEGGYFWIVNEEEYIHAYNEMISRIKALSKRARGLRRGWHRSLQPSKQLQLI